MSNHALSTDSEASPISPAEREWIPYDTVEIRAIASELVIPQSDFRRLDCPSAEALFPLEYAFHLLGDFREKTVVDLGCGDGVKASVLALLGARVVGADASHEALKRAAERLRANRVHEKATLVHCESGRIPVADGSVERVLCVRALRRENCIEVGRQIRRILKPGGISVFIQPLAGFRWLKALKRHLSMPESPIGRYSFLTLEQAHNVSRAVGRVGRCREFILTSRLLEQIGVQRVRTIKRAYELDAWILRRFGFARPLAASLVWEARKEC